MVNSMEKRYSISDASRQVEVENHVLRYWEEELLLPIERNTKGHRFYKESDIQTLKTIKDLKEQGFQLKAIKLLMPDIDRVRTMSPQEVYQLREELNQQVLREEEVQDKNVVPIQSAKRVQTPVKKSSEEKMKQFENMLTRMISRIVRESEPETEKRIYEAVNTKFMKEIDYLMREKDEAQQKQMELLKQILEEVRKEVPETEEAAASDETKSFGMQQKKKGKNKTKRRKLFAKSV